MKGQKNKSSFLFSVKRYLLFPLQWPDLFPAEGRIPDWGKFPLICLVASLGVWTISIGYVLARDGNSTGGESLFWLGLAVIYIPVIIRLLSRDLGRGEAIGMMLVIALCTYLVRYLGGPAFFTAFDEFLHWRTAYDILSTQHLFTNNSLLPVSPLYPGLESITAALVSLTGLDIVQAGLAVIGVSRLVMILGLYLLFEQMTKSSRTAGLAVLIYTGSSTFLYFDSQYGYETLALPLAVVAIYMLVRRVSSYGWSYWIWTILSAITIFAIVPTHHATSYALIGFLLLWTCTDLYVQWQGGPAYNPFEFAAWLILLCLIWIATAATITIQYLTPIVGGALQSAVGLLTGQSVIRQLFVNSAGQGSAIYERIFAYGSVLIIVLIIPFGLWQWWLRYRGQSISIALAIAVLVYPALPLMRLSSGAWELSDRMSGFIYIAVAYIVALGMIELPLPARFSEFRKWFACVAVFIIFAGGIAAGSSPQTRLPSPYRPAAEELSIDRENIAAAQWAQAVLGPNNRMAGDRTETILMGAYGTQRMITSSSDNVSISGLFLDDTVTPSDQLIISEARIRYLVIDFRISTVLPILGYYFESWEQLITPYVPPINNLVLEKYDHVRGASRVFDSGDIVLYDVGALQNAP